MNPPQLYYISPEWDKYGRLTRDSLAWNALDADDEQVAAWTAALSNRRPLAKGWKPPSAMLLDENQPGDFIAACHQTFAVSPAAWKAIEDLVQPTVEALPVKVTHSTDPEAFDFSPLPRGKQPNYLLLHGVFEVLLQHGQGICDRTGSEEGVEEHYRSESQSSSGGLSKVAVV